MDRWWWRDRIDIWFGASRIRLARIAAGFSGRVTRRITIECDDGSWQPQLAQLREALRRPEWRDADVAVTLSNRFGRFGVLPASAALLSDADLLKLATASFATTHGDGTARWRIAISPGGPNRSLLIAAIELELFDAIQAAVGEARMRVRALRPYFTEAFALARPTSAWPHYWFAALEPDCFCAGTFDRGGWGIVRARRWEVGASPEARGAALEALIRQSSLALAEDLPLHVFAPRDIAIERPAASTRPWLRTGERHFVSMLREAA